MTDGHMHLEYGSLTLDYVLEFVESAKKNNISKIQILDHTHRFKEFIDIYSELKVFEVQKIWLDKKVLDSIDDFISLMEHVKTLDLGVEITYGLEVCYTPKSEKLLRSILSNYHFDFLVGAVHSIDGILYDMSFSKDLLWNKFDVNFIYQRYYELLNSCLDSRLFTQLAHPDTIKMFNYYPDYDLKETYELLALKLVKYDVLCENNTGCNYRYNHSDIGLSDEFLSIMKKNNVKMICASDAHHPDHVGKHIIDIYEKTMK